MLLKVSNIPGQLYGLFPPGEICVLGGGEQLSALNHSFCFAFYSGTRISTTPYSVRAAIHHGPSCTYADVLFG